MSKEGDYLNDDQDNGNEGLEEKIIVHNAIRWIQTYSAEQLEKFFVQRTKTCISNFYFFSNMPLQREKGAPELLLRSAFEKAVQDQLIASFVCRSAIVRSDNNWATYLGNGGSLRGYENVALEEGAYTDAFDNDQPRYTVEIKDPESSLLHRCRAFNVDSLNSQYILSDDVRSLLFHPDLFSSITPKFLSTIFEFLSHNEHIMNALVLITIDGSIHEEDLNVQGGNQLLDILK